jgi:thymidylate synthase (FAD)
MESPLQLIAQEYVPMDASRLDPLNDGKSGLELIRVSGSDLDIVNAARVSYGRISEAFSDRDQKLLQFLMDHDHTSPFEHNQLSFRVKAPIFVQRQWMRHRMNSYNEISYRYVKSALEFYIPAPFRMQDTKNKQSSFGMVENSDSVQARYQEALHAAVAGYEALLAVGVCREQARGLLPLSTYTEFIFTTNLHSLMHFIRLRTHAGAQQEIQAYGWGLLKLALPHFPASLRAFCEKYSIDLNKLEAPGAGTCV